MLHAERETHLLFLRARDMSSFLSETDDERLLSDVVLPGTHDSVSFYGWPVAQCQSPDQPLFNQLMSGIRALDVRQAVVDGVLIAYHGIAPQRTSFSAILHTLYHFLREHPRECLVVSVKQEDSANTPPRVFSRLVREEIERSQGGMGMWWLENRIPRLGEVRGRCIMFSRFGGDGREWEGGLEGLGIHPTIWPDSKQEGFEWDLKGTTVRTHDWYSIPSLLSLPEKTSLCIENLVPPPTDPPTLGITFLSAAGGPLSLPPFCALGFGWPRWGLGVEGINARVGRWLIDRLTASGDRLDDTDSEKIQWSTASNYSEAQLLGGRRTQSVDGSADIEVETLAGGLEDSKLPVRGWVYMDYFAEPDGGIVPLLVENNFIRRS